jgi:DNA-binding transcriptional LysR family regulator
MARSINPRLLCLDAQVSLAAALSGAGIARLPEPLCAPAISGGRLEHILPEWAFSEGIIHPVYASRRALLPSVRAFLDFMAERTPGVLGQAAISYFHAVSGRLSSALARCAGHR